MLLVSSITSPQSTRFFPRYFPCRCCRLVLATLLLGLVLSRTARADPHVNGTWSAVEPWPIVPIHMILLKTGKVLSYGTNPAGQGGQGFFYDVWDPSIGLANPSSHSTLPTQTATNIFCSGQVNLADGEVLILGGSQVVHGVRNSGTAYTQLFDSDTERLYREDRNMFQARWYPSVTVLGNGNVVAQGGVNAARLPSLTPELYNVQTKTWRLLSNATSDLYEGMWYYPRVFLSIRNTLVIFPRNTNQVYTLNPLGQGALNLVGTVPGPDFLHMSPATMIDRFKVLIIQGGQQASVVDIRNPDRPVSVVTGSLRETRLWANAVALPNGEVLMVGGASVYESLRHAVRYGEIWNPVTGMWRVVGAGERSRLYHSAALLLPDATVLVGGGGPPGPERNMNAEIYEPPYLFAADGSRAVRPVIATLDAPPRYGQATTVTLADAALIARVSLIRFGSVTHSFNMEERALALPFAQPTATTVTVRFWNDRASVPPGWYMLFLVNDAGVPSVAEIVNFL